MQTLSELWVASAQCQEAAHWPLSQQSLDSAHRRVSPHRPLSRQGVSTARSSIRHTAMATCSAAAAAVQLRKLIQVHQQSPGHNRQEPQARMPRLETTAPANCPYIHSCPIAPSSHFPQSPPCSQHSRHTPAVLLVGRNHNDIKTAGFTTHNPERCHELLQAQRKSCHTACSM